MSLIALGTFALLALLSPLLLKAGPRVGGLIAALVPAGLGVWFASKLKAVGSGEVLLERTEWLPQLGVDLSFRIDGLSLTFALLICFIGSMVLLYASSYLAKNRRIGYFFSIIISFMTAMLGLVLSDNLILLFIFWELTSITSFLLIGFDFDRDAARKSALQALLVTGLGGLALLGGVVLLGVTVGSFEIADVLSASIHEHPLFTPIAILILLGALTKSAIFPFHFWLPKAMEAPSPVSALLHSATMVKAGVYLVARLSPTMHGAPLWDNTLTILGGFTMLSAAFLATRQSQLKRILAYSTVSSLGILIMLLGMGEAKAAATYLLAHALFKGCLFLVAGSVTKQTGQKYPDALGGLRRAMPITCIAAVLAGLSMAGMVPFIGFAGKELLLKASLHHEPWTALWAAAAALAGLLTVFAAAIVTVRPFFGSASEHVANAKESDWRQLLGPSVLALGGLVAGLAPALFMKPLVGSMIASIEGVAHAEPVKIGWLELIWPVTTALALSVLALVGGAAFYLGRSIYNRVTAPLDALNAIGPDRGYTGVLGSVLSFASLQTRVLQNGSLQSYVRITLLVALGTGLAALSRSGQLNGLADVSIHRPTTLEIMSVLVLIAAAIGTTFQRTALASVALLGGVGFMVAMLFSLYGAPDVAMTQFAVETLVVIIFVLVLFHLPRYSSFTSPWPRFIDVIFASLIGVTMAVITFIIASREAPSSIATYFAERAYTEGNGRNVVNVILVDFRAMDTLGEVFVIGVAAIGVYTLLRLRPLTSARTEAEDQGPSENQPGPGEEQRP